MIDLRQYSFFLEEVDHETIAFEYVNIISLKIDRSNHVAMIPISVLYNINGIRKHLSPENTLSGDRCFFLVLNQES